MVGKQAPNVLGSQDTMAENGLLKFIKAGRTVMAPTTFGHLSLSVQFQLVRLGIKIKHIFLINRSC